MGQRTSRKAAVRKKSDSKLVDFFQLLLFYILPFIAVNSILFIVVTAKPKYELVVAPTEDYRSTTATFTIRSRMPLKNVTITFNEEPLNLVKVGPKSYQADITSNGILDIFMQNFNGMTVSDFEVIDSLDDEAPGITFYDMEEGLLTIVVDDSLSGIDFDNLHAIAADGTIVAPQSVDPATGTVTFPIGEGGLTVSVKDLSGNEYLPNFSVVKVPADASSDGHQLLVQ